MNPFNCFSHAEPSIGNSKVWPSSDENTIAFTSSTAWMPSGPGAITGSPSRIAFTKFWITMTCGTSAFANGISSIFASGFTNHCVAVRLNSSIFTELRAKVSLLFSTTRVPRVPTISSRLVPGASPVEVMNNPVDRTVESFRELEGKTTVERRYYLASLALGVEACARAVRGRWGVENKLQWVLGRVFRRRPEPGTRRLCRRKPGHSGPVGLEPIVAG